MKVIVTGITGQIGQLVGRQLLASGHQVVGIDRRPWHTAPEAIEVHKVDVRKRAAEDVFRTFRPDALIHMATVTHIKRSSDDRYRINLHGTRAVIDHCHKYGTKRAIFVGRHTYYGAAPDSPLYQREDAPPMAASSFPELADLVAADLYAGTALWRYPELDLAVMRMCYSLGPLRHGTLASFLRGPWVPMVLGFDPLFQFMHELDAASSICAALEAGLRGVFNVAGPDPVPLSLVIKETGRRAIPVPEQLFRFALGRFGLPRLPRGAIEHVKYPIVIDHSAFRAATGWKHEHDEDAAMAAYRAAG